MRRNSASVISRVDRAPGSRPIRLRLGPDVFAMTEREAISLANQLIDATERKVRHER